MKKKIFLTMLIVSIFACLFAVAVSAADIPEWTEITEVSGMPDKSVFGTDGTSGATSRVLMSDGITYPAYYIFKNSTTLEISYDDLNSKASKSYGPVDVVRVEAPSGAISSKISLFKTESGYTSLVTASFPEGFTTMGGYTFYDNKTTDTDRASSVSSLVSVSLPSTLTTMGQQEFKGCTKLEELVIPNGVETIKTDFARNAISLKKLVLPSTIKTIETTAFRYAGIEGDVVIPEGCTTIGQYAFANTNIKKVTLPSTLASVSSFIFTECHSLTDVYSNSPKIGDQMFYRCENVKNVVLKNTVSIGKQAFNNDQDTLANKTTQIVNLVLPEGLTSIGEYAFTRCQITEIVLPSTLTTIGSSVFLSCTSLKRAVVLGSIIGTQMFQSCSNLNELVLTENITTMKNQCIGGASSSFTTYYTGTDYERIRTLGVATGADRFSTSKTTYCTYEDYINKNYTAKTCLFVYDCNLCDVAFDGIHTNPGDDGDCTTALICSMCKEYTIREAMAAHISSERITYVSFMENGEHYIGCTNEGCEYGEKKILAPLFVSLGYSVSEDGGVTTGFRVNYDAIIEYENATGEKLNYGLFVAVYDRIGEKDIINLETGKTNENAIALEVSNREFSILNIKINGFETPEQKSASFSFGMFVVATKDETKKLVYLQHDAPVDGSKYSYITYNSLIG